MTQPQADSSRIAVLIPCHNEALTIGKVVADFRRALPEASIHVYDNASSDDTSRLAREAGAVVGFEKRKGKGFVVSRMLQEVDADIYLMVDGDDTYPADRARDLVEPIRSGRADMVVGNRLIEYSGGSFRPLHVFGNQLVIRTINLIFDARVHDVMSGFRAMSREFVDQVPIVSKGFEIETEITLQALYRSFIIEEVPVPYGERPKGSFSKLNTVRDGIRVLVKIVDIFKAYRPLLFFFLLSAVVAAFGALLGFWPVLQLFVLGQRGPLSTLIVAVAIELVAVVLLCSGLVLDSINHHFREVTQLVLRDKRSTSSRSGTGG